MMVIALAKTMMSEIETMRSMKDTSVFRDTDQAMQHFNWENLWLELVSKAPTLLHLYRQLFRGAPKALICFAVSLIIKWRSPKMGLVQRAISAVMYGNGANKQVSTYFHNFNTTLLSVTCHSIAIQLPASSNGMLIVQWNHQTHEVTDCKV